VLMATMRIVRERISLGPSFRGIETLLSLRHAEVGDSHMRREFRHKPISHGLQDTVIGGARTGDLGHIT